MTLICGFNLRPLQVTILEHIVHLSHLHMAAAMDMYHYGTHPTLGEPPPTLPIYHIPDFGY